jgi:hypothetical protein
LQILLENEGFIENRTAKLKKWKAIYFNEEWFLGMRFRIEFGMTLWQYLEWRCDNIRNDIITIFGMILWQHSGWRIFFWFWNITCYESGWGWRCDNIWIFTYKLHKEKYDFNLAIKQTICCRSNMRNWWNHINLYSQFSCNWFCIISIT